MFKKILGLCLLSAFAFSASAQSPHKFAVIFTDKADSPFSIDEPEAFLSQRAIDRRTKQDIQITETDLPVNPSYLEGVKSSGGKLLNHTKWLNTAIVEGDSSILASLNALNYVDTVILILNGNFFQKRSMNNKFNEITFEEADYGDSYRQIEMMNGHRIHDLGFKGEGLLIGVLDGGFTNANTIESLQPLFNNNQVIGVRDVVEQDNDPYHGSGHGTSVLSCMGALLIGEIIGTAPDANYLLIRTEDVASEFPIEEFNWAIGAEYADSMGADVLNTSLGYSTFDDTLMSHTYSELTGDSTFITKASNIAASKGMLIVTSAGNEGGGEWNFITAPADAKDVLTVGAVDADLNRAGFSSVGPNASDSIKPDVCAMGEGVLVSNSSDRQRFGSGTSYAGPILAGMAASFWQMRPDLTAIELRDLIKSIGHQAKFPDNNRGYGVPDFLLAISDGTTINPNVFENDELFLVYPNPSSNQFEIQFYSPEQSEVVISVFDAAGKLVLTQTESAPAKKFHETKLLGTNKLTSGLYILKLETKTQRLSRKIQKL
jgi:serine protease AprX